MRRWLAPSFAAAVTAVLLIALIPLERVPAPLLRWIAGAEGSTALMLYGGLRVELAVDAPLGAERPIAARLEGAGFEIRGIIPGRIAADLAVTGDRDTGDSSLAPVGPAPGVVLDDRLLASGVFWPYEIAVVELPPDFSEQTTPWLARESALVTTPLQGSDIDAVRHDNGAIAVALTRPTAASSLQSDGRRRAPAVITRDLHNVVVIHALGAVSKDELYFDRVGDYPIGRIAGLVEPAVSLTGVDFLEPSATVAQAERARQLLAALIALLVFAAIAVAWRRPQLRSLIARDHDSGGRLRVAGATGVALAVIAIGLAGGETGPFMAAVEAGLLGDTNATTRLDLGFAAVMAGFVAALIATLLRPTWRRQLVCDGDAGRRVLRRGFAGAAIAGALLLAAPLCSETLNLLYRAWPTGEAIAYAAMALAFVAAVFAVGARALGGPYLIAGLAVLATSAAAFGRHLSRLLEAGAIDGGTIGVLAFSLAVIAATTAALVSRRFGDRAASLRAPIGGVMPVAVGVGFALLIVVHYLWGWASLWRDLGIRLAIAMPLVIAAALFELRIRRGLGGARVARLAGQSCRGELAAVAVSVAFFTGLIALETLAAHLGVPAFAVLTALATAGLLDLAAELRARWRRPTLRPVWHIHQPQLAGLVERALTGGGIAVHMRAQYLRTCLGIFGAFIPITALVDRDRADEARHLIRSVLG